MFKGLEVPMCKMGKEKTQEICSGWKMIKLQNLAFWTKTKISDFGWNFDEKWPTSYRKLNISNSTILDTVLLPYVYDDTTAMMYNKVQIWV